MKYIIIIKYKETLLKHIIKNYTYKLGLSTQCAAVKIILFDIKVPPQLYLQVSGSSKSERSRLS